MFHAFLLEECKTTEKGSLSVKREWIIKIVSEARRVGKTPAFGFGFQRMPYGVSGEWVALPLPVLARLLKERGEA